MTKGKIFTVVILGVLAGVGVAYLLNSEKGEEIMGNIRDSVNDLIDRATTDEEEGDDVTEHA